MVHARRGETSEATKALVPVLSQRLTPERIEMLLGEYARSAVREAFDSRFTVLRPVGCYARAQ